MKSVICLAIFAVAFCNSFINKDYVKELKKIAPFEVYDVEENPLRDYTDEEIKGMLGDLSVNDLSEPILPILNMYFGKYKDLPEEYDFRKEYPTCNVGGIKDQGSCGGCWAFAASEALQHRFCSHSKGEQRPNLSPQNLLSCDKSSYGCNGGRRQTTWDFFKINGIVTEECFPFTSYSGTVEKCVTQCKNGQEWKPYKISTYGNFTTPAQIKEELYKNGPVHTGFQVYGDFLNYKGGIYRHVSGWAQGGHAVVFVGYGVEDGVNYWIVQNSWGPNWGESGYFRIKMGECQIDVNSVAGIPLLE